MPPRRSRRLMNLPPDGGELPLKKSQVPSMSGSGFSQASSTFVDTTGSATSAATSSTGSFNNKTSNVNNSQNLANPKAAVHHDIVATINASRTAPTSTNKKTNDLKKVRFLALCDTSRSGEIRQAGKQRSPVIVETASASGAIGDAKRKSKSAVYSQLDKHLPHSDSDSHDTYNFAAIPLASTKASAKVKTQRSVHWASNAYDIKYYLGEGAPSHDDVMTPIRRTGEAGNTCKKSLSSSAFMKSSVKAYKNTFSGTNRTADEVNVDRRTDEEHAYVRSTFANRGIWKGDAEIRKQPAHSMLSSSTIPTPSGFKTSISYYTPPSINLHQPSNTPLPQDVRCSPLADRFFEGRHTDKQRTPSGIKAAPAPIAVGRKRKSKRAMLDQLDKCLQDSDSDNHDSYNFAAIPSARTASSRQDHSLQQTSNAYVIKHYLGEGAPSHDDVFAAIQRAKDAGQKCRKGLSSSAAFMKAGADAYKNRFLSKNRTADQHNVPQRADGADRSARSKLPMRNKGKDNTKVQRQSAYSSSSTITGSRGCNTSVRDHSPLPSTLRQPPKLPLPYGVPRVPDLFFRGDDAKSNARRTEFEVNSKSSSLWRTSTKMRTAFPPSPTTTAPHGDKTSTRHYSSPPSSQQQPFKFPHPCGTLHVHTQPFGREDEETAVRRAEAESSHFWQTWTKLQTQPPSNINKGSIQADDHQHIPMLFRPRLDYQASSVGNHAIGTSSAVVGETLSVAHHKRHQDLRAGKTGEHRGVGNKRAKKFSLRVGTSEQNNDNKKPTAKKRRVLDSDDDTE